MQQFEQVMQAVQRGKALENNHGLYEAVFAAQGLTHHRSPALWYCTERVPMYYSNLVTRSANWRPDPSFERIATIAQENSWSSWSIKDSYDVLDLREFGLVRLFRAKWLYLTASDFRSSAEPLSSWAWEPVSTAEGHLEWCQAWDPDPDVGPQIFSDKMLNDPAITFCLLRIEGQVVGGCLLNSTENVLGISNVFYAESLHQKYDCSKLDFWSRMIFFIQKSFGPIDLVGYEQQDTVNQACKLGFVPCGDLSIWISDSSNKS